MTVETDPIGFESVTRRTLFYGIRCSVEKALGLVQRNEDPHVFMPRQVRSRHVALEEARVGDSCVATYAGTVLEPPQVLARCYHAPKQIGPRGGERKCCCGEGLACRCISEFGQRYRMPMAGSVRIGYRASTHPDFSQSSGLDRRPRGQEWESSA